MPGGNATAKGGWPPKAGNFCFFFDAGCKSPHKQFGGMFFLVKTNTPKKKWYRSLCLSKICPKFSEFEPFHSDVSPKVLAICRILLARGGCAEILQVLGNSQYQDRGLASEK